MKDFGGSELKIGDVVAVVVVDKRRLEKGKVVSLGRRMATIEYTEPRKYAKNTTCRYYEHIVKIEDVPEIDTRFRKQIITRKYFENCSYHEAEHGIDYDKKVAVFVECFKGCCWEHRIEAHTEHGFYDRRDGVITKEYTLAEVRENALKS